MNGGNRSDQFLNDHCLANACSSEDPRFSTFGKRSNQVDHFQSGFKYLHSGGLLIESWSSPVDGVSKIGLDITLIVYRTTQYIKNPSQCFRSLQEL